MFRDGVHWKDGSGLAVDSRCITFEDLAQTTRTTSSWLRALRPSCRSRSSNSYREPHYLDIVWDSSNRDNIGSLRHFREHLKVRSQHDLYVDLFLGQIALQ